MFMSIVINPGVATETGVHYCDQSKCIQYHLIFVVACVWHLCWVLIAVVGVYRQEPN